MKTQRYAKQRTFCAAAVFSLLLAVGGAVAVAGGDKPLCLFVGTPELNAAFAPDKR